MKISWNPGLGWVLKIRDRLVKVKPLLDSIDLPKKAKKP
jgi:hypothetical protein